MHSDESNKTANTFSTLMRSSHDIDILYFESGLSLSFIITTEASGSYFNHDEEMHESALQGIHHSKSIQE
eukprot:6894332-Ditylum_brightwellii.AAC.1